MERLSERNPVSFTRRPAPPRSAPRSPAPSKAPRLYSGKAGEPTGGRPVEESIRVPRRYAPESDASQRAIVSSPLSKISIEGYAAHPSHSDFDPGSMLNVSSGSREAPVVASIRTARMRPP